MTEEQDNSSGGIQKTAETRKSKGKRQWYNKKKKQGNQKGKAINSSKFVGSETGMRGHVFQCREESKSTLQFSKTCKELIRYVSNTYT